MTCFLCLKATTAPFCWHEPRDGLIEVPDEQAAAYRELKHLYRECDEKGAPLDEKPREVPVSENHEEGASTRKGKRGKAKDE